MQSFLKLYCCGSCLIGLIEIIDALVLIQNAGAFGSAPKIFAIFELFWVLVTCAAVAVFFVGRANLLIPVSFWVYNVSGWCLTFILAALSAGTAFALNSAGENVLPLWVCYCGLGFGVYFVVANAIMLTQLLKKATVVN